MLIQDEYIKRLIKFMDLLHTNASHLQSSELGDDRVVWANINHLSGFIESLKDRLEEREN